MSTCPYCGTTYESTYPPVDLSERQRFIYNTVAAAGRAGVQTIKLIKEVYGDNPPENANGTIRVSIFEANRKLKKRGHKIMGRRDAGYVLVKDSE